ncbi:pseudouridine-5-phosphate glycosidase [Nostoc sp. 3335mG]|nr:pseudouridine-5-phosphate glycosidase [Nostoc sp. 3335mG]
MTKSLSAQLPIAFSKEVATARERGTPLVALESHLIAHGAPYPRNFHLGCALEAIVREEGAVPATIAVISGTLHVGLEREELDTLARNPVALKVSRADLAFVIAEGLTGVTTVAATMIVAARLGIKVFATGGIGGVHREAQKSFDISADLDELARTGVIVVSAGAKSILDIPKTLEALETRGVPVVTFGSKEFPSFWSRSSGLSSPLSLDSPVAIARFQRVREQLGLDGGMLVANPVPTDDEIPRAEIEAHIEQALESARREGVSGKAVTAHLLTEISALSDARSTKTSIALVANNARLAAQIAVAIVRG